jgi:very-short-patch-repair endonuclease
MKFDGVNECSRIGILHKMETCYATIKTLCENETCSGCFERSFASHEKAAFWSTRNVLKPRQVLRSSNKKYWFDCIDCGHCIDVALCNITIGQWCRYCNRKALCENDECKQCFEKSFAAHPFAPSWSTRNEKTPRQVNRASDKMFFFDCKRCNHTFQSRLYSIKTDTFCPYCSNQTLCDKQTCTACFEKSCANHRIGSLWSEKNPLGPRMMFLQSNKKVFVVCDVCMHESHLTPNDYVSHGGVCGYCNNQRLCVKEDCDHCFKRSFASHEKASCWSVKNRKTPREVFKGAEAKYLFECEKCKCEFETRLYNVLSGYWCPYCKNKTEGKVAAFLQTSYPHYKSQVRFDWCRNVDTNNVMPFDFGLEDEKVLIEVDGPQHFEQIAKWDNPEIVRKKDIQKIKLCNEKGYSIIHILQKDIWTDRVDWRKLLMDAIMLCKATPKQCIFIDNSHVYDAHIRELRGIEWTLRGVDS